MIQPLCVAARLGIADKLKEGAKTAKELADETGAHAESMFRMLRALASLGIFEEIEGKRFGLTPQAETLLSDAPVSLRSILIWAGDKIHWETWTDFEVSLMTGGPAFDHRMGMNAFEYFKENPRASKIFDNAMTSFSQSTNDVLLEAFDFSKYSHIVDVAGGHGSLLHAILDKHSALKGTLFDLPHVVKGAPSQERCEIVGGNMFESIPEGADAYLMKSIIHNWDDQSCVKILSTCKKAMGDKGHVLLVERVIPPGNDPFDAKLTDLEMLVFNPGGKERTEPEYRALFEEAGLKLTEIVKTRTTRNIIIGVSG